MIAKIRAWLNRHINLFLHRPTNGRSAMKKMDEHLVEIKRNKRAIRLIAKDIRKQTDGLKEVARANGIQDHNR